MCVRSGLAALVAVAVFAVTVAYLAGLGEGAVSLVGYDSRTERLQGFAGTSWFPIRLGLPVRLDAGDAIRADYDVEAKFGAVILTVAPPLIFRTSLQAASAYVEGKRAGSVIFVAQAAGWYSFSAEPSANGGPRCHGPDVSAFEVIAGSSHCPTFDVSYSVKWRIADARQAAAGTPRLFVPRPHETLVTTRIR